MAESGNYSNFSDRWNLDVGASESPISSLTVTITTGTKSGAGTDDDIYFGLTLKSGATKKWLLDKAGYNDFENGNQDEYYLYINDKKFNPSDIERVWIEKKHIDHSMGEAWYLSKIKIDVNGNNAFSKSIDKWLKGNDSVSYNVDWSNITNTSDPII